MKISCEDPSSGLSRMKRVTLQSGSYINPEGGAYSGNKPGPFRTVPVKAQREHHFRVGGGSVDDFLFFSLWVLYGWLVGWVLLLLFQGGPLMEGMAGMTAAMAMGMIVGVAAGVVLPVVFHLPFFVSTVAGMGIGGGVGWAAGWRCGPAGVLEGWLAGLMGGMKGTMLGVMVPPEYHTSLFRLINVLFASVLFLVFQLIQGSVENARQRRPFAFFLIIGLFLVISHFFTVGGNHPDGPPQHPSARIFHSADIL